MEEMKGRILIIDDDVELCEALHYSLQGLGHEVTCKFNLKDGMKEVSSENYDVVFLDVYLPDGNGLSVLPNMQGNGASPEVIIMTGDGEPDGAELAIKWGAWDYIEKPLSINVLTLSLKRVLQYRKEKYSSRPANPIKRDDIIGESPPLKDCLNLVAQSAESDANILITGESGTGKELFASAMHDNSVRKERNFVIVDCAALPETLVESVLFGHEKGAFTGAEKARDGLVMQADGGTLFLDEVGELPLSVQKAFLRVLQERRFRPIGGKREIKSDFRLIAATNQDLDRMVKDGTFRNDLMFRIRSVVLDLPPLRERKEDIEAFVSHFIKKICKRYGLAVKEYDPAFLRTMVAYHWPGNVRELINTLEHAIGKARYESTLFPKHLPVNLRIHVARSSVGKKRGPRQRSFDEASVKGKLPTMKDFRESVIEDTEKRYLRELISLTSGDIKEACRISGLGRARLYDLMKTRGVSKSTL